MKHDPSPSQGELETIKSVLAITNRSADHGKYTKCHTNRLCDGCASLVALIAAETDRARRDELSHVQLEYGHYVAQTYVNGQAMTIEERIASLEDEDATKK